MQITYKIININIKSVIIYIGIPIIINYRNKSTIRALI